MVDWEYQYKKVVAFLGANNGHLPTPKSDKTLNKWLSNQRYLLVMGGNANNLEEWTQKMRKLKSIGFNIGSGCERLLMTYEDDMNCNDYEELKAYQIEENGSSTTTEAFEDDVNCGSDYEELKAYEIEEKGNSTNTEAFGEEQPAGGVSSKSLEKSHSGNNWDTKYAALIAYKNEHGHCNVPYQLQAEAGIL